MLLSGLLFVGYLTVAADIEMKPAITFEMVPEESEYYLTRPADAVFDNKGRLMMLDLSAATIFVWNADGTYLKNFGKEGDGPGEFSFRSRSGGPQGYVSSNGDEIYVYSGATKKLSVFDKDFNFKTSKPITFANGRMEAFRVLKNGNLLMFNSSYFSDEPYRLIGTYSPEGEMIKELKRAKDETWSWGSEGGRRKVVLHPYTATLTTTYDRVNDRILVGHGGKPTFDVLDGKGNLVKSVTFKRSAQEITNADKDEYNEIPWFKSQSFFKVDFPKMKSIYAGIIPLADKGYLVYNISEFYNTVEGVLVDNNGKILGRYNQRFGENGGVYGSNGKLIGVTLNEDDDYVVQTLTPVLPGS